jgi:Fe-S cluster biogenesis protein NfuA
MPKIDEILHTPDPNVVRFMLKEPVASGFPRRFISAETAATDPTAKGLFDVGNVDSVVMVDKMVVVAKGGGVSWDELLPKLAPIIRQAPPVAATAEAPGFSLGPRAQGDPFLEKVFAALKENIYPFMSADGGGLEVVSREGKQVMIRYTGACQNCPAGMVGTLMAIEGILRAEVDPEIKVVTV